jgi:large subunit ribosomal protein L25
VKTRDGRGKRESRRLRRAGTIPAILYGHGEANVSLVVSADEMSTVMRHGGRVVELKGSVNEKAFIRDTQWDTYGTEVLHVDFARVSEHERIHLQVAIELRGHAAGVKEGGVVEQVVHELEIECEALAIPEKLELKLDELKLGESLTASDVRLPEGVKLLSDPDMVVVHCVRPMSEEEIAAGEGVTAEPEIIGGRKPGEEAEE